MEIYFYCSSDIATFQKKKMIHKTSFLNHKFPCHLLKILKLLNKIEKQRNNVGKTAVVFPQIFGQPLGALACSLGITKA